MWAWKPRVSGKTYFHAFFMSILKPVTMPTQERLHIGHLIKSVFDESGMTVAEFARRIHCARPNVYSIFERYDIGMEQLVNISLVLEHNFFDDIQEYYSIKSTLYPQQLNLSINLMELSEEERVTLVRLATKGSR